MSNTSEFTALNVNSETTYTDKDVLCWMRINIRTNSGSYLLQNITARDHRHGNTIKCTSIIWMWVCRSYPSSRLWQKRTAFHVSFQTLKVRETPRFNTQLKQGQKPLAVHDFDWSYRTWQSNAVQLHLRSSKFIPTGYIWLQRQNLVVGNSHYFRLPSGV